jgi:nucleotide-binding universal stress UspA family protein
MKRIRKLLVPTDFSENSRRGLLYACSLGAENKGDLTVLHVANEFNAWELYTDEFSFLESTTRRAWPTDRALSEANLELNRFLEPHLEAMKELSCVSKRIVLGAIAEQIVTVAEEENADLVVMSPRRHRGLRRILTGGVTDKVSRMSPCPVLSVTPPPPSRAWRGGLLPVFFGWPRQRTARA